MSIGIYPPYQYNFYNSSSLLHSATQEDLIRTAVLQHDHMEPVWLCHGDLLCGARVEWNCPSIAENVREFHQDKLVVLATSIDFPGSHEIRDFRRIVSE